MGEVVDLTQKLKDRADDLTNSEENDEVTVGQPELHGKKRLFFYQTKSDKELKQMAKRYADGDLWFSVDVPESLVGRVFRGIVTVAENNPDELEAMQEQGITVIWNVIEEAVHRFEHDGQSYPVFLRHKLLSEQDKQRLVPKLRAAIEKKKQELAQ